MDPQVSTAQTGNGRRHASTVFISYANSDRPAAHQIERALEKEGISVFTHQDLAPGSIWAEELSERIHQATAIIVLVSSDWLNSQWTFAELALALDRASDIRIIPVKLSGSVAIPPILAPYQYIDMSQTVEPGVRDLVRQLKLGETGGSAPQSTASSVNDILRTSATIRRTSGSLNTSRGPVWLVTVLDFIAGTLDGSPRRVRVMLLLVAPLLLLLGVFGVTAAIAVFLIQANLGGSSLAAFAAGVSITVCSGVFARLMREKRRAASRSRGKGASHGE